MKRHPFDPISLILGLAFSALGLSFLIGDPDVAEIGWKWIWPFPVLVLGLLFVVSAGRRMLPARTEPAEATEELPAAEND